MIFELLLSEVNMLVNQLSCLILSDPMDVARGSSVHGILQAKILGWVVIPFSRGVFPTRRLNPGIELWSPALQPDSLQSEPAGKSLLRWTPVLRPSEGYLKDQTRILPYKLSFIYKNKHSVVSNCNYVITYMYLLIRWAFSMVRSEVLWKEAGKCPQKPWVDSDQLTYSLGGWNTASGVYFI